MKAFVALVVAVLTAILNHMEARRDRQKAAEADARKKKAEADEARARDAAARPHPPGVRDPFDRG